MRGACVFSGSSHPGLVESICDRLGTHPAKAELKKFANGETSVEISTLPSRASCGYMSEETELD